MKSFEGVYALRRPQTTQVLGVRNWYRKPGVLVQQLEYIEIRHNKNIRIVEVESEVSYDPTAAVADEKRNEQRNRRRRSFLPRDATQSAVMPCTVCRHVCLSVRQSLMFSYRDHT